MSEARIDFETRSDVDLRKCGSGPYFETPHWRALMAAYAIDDGPIQMWLYNQPCPDDLRQHIEAGGWIRAFNASFERQCFEQLHTRAGWPLPRFDRYRCTAAEAAAMALPRSLDGVGEALGLPVKKDKRGTALIRKFSMPRRPRKDEPPGLYWNEPEDHPTEFQEFQDYCRDDVLVEAAAAAHIVALSEYEQDLYTNDQRINARGIRIDRTSATAALAIADKAKLLLDREMRAITAGAVPACSQPAKLVEWVQAQGVEIGSAAKAEITDLLDLEDLPPQVRRALEVRQEAAKTSVAKLSAMLARTNADGRVRNSFLINAAGTGRWSSLGVQLQNLPRPRPIYEDEHPDTRVLFRAFRAGEPDWLREMYGDEFGRPLNLISDAIRGFIWAAPGHDLVQADYSGIEGAVAAWFAGEDWKVQALFDIIADPSLPDLYRRTAASIMNTTTDVVTKKHPLRQSVGKVSELSLGYAGGVSAFHSMSKNHGVKLEPLFEPVWETADAERRAKAVKRYEACLKRGDNKADVLSREAWIACEIIKTGWRAANPAIAASWRLLEGAIRDAIRNPGVKVDVLKCTYLVAHGFLWCRLPSGRCLSYGSPKLKDQVWAKLRLDDGTYGDSEVMDRDYAERLERRGDAIVDGASTPKATALGVNSVTKKWERFALYGGLAFENIVQAIARDLLANGIKHAEAAGYPVIGHVHDEIITEVPCGFGDVKEFERIICELPGWAAGLPLTADGWRGKRYRK